MKSTSVSVLVPAAAVRTDATDTVRALDAFFHTTGFPFRVSIAEGSMRQALSDADGDIVVIVDPDLPYAVSAIGDAVALIESGAADVVFAAPQNAEEPDAFLRWLLVTSLPDRTLHLSAFSAEALRVLAHEAKVSGSAASLEIAYLANKYGFRIERLIVEAEARRPLYGTLEALKTAIAVRLTDRRNGYRAPRRCPVCFSSEVWSSGQIPGNVIRVCGRCKCRYLNQVASPDESKPVRRELRAQPAPAEPADPFEETAHGRTAKEKTMQRRLNALRNQVAPRGRVLEIGVRDGAFGAAAAREYEYVGIDRSEVTARGARGRGLEVYCSTLTGFVNTGPAFDAITLYHVFENMNDPHDALARIKDLLKPGGLLFLSALDTEGVFFLLSERRRAAQNFRTRVILYSRSALIELLERSGFEIVSVGPDLAYRDHRFLRYRLTSRWPSLGPLGEIFLKVMPDPLLVSSGSIRIVARRRAGAPLNVRAIRSVEPTHAR